MDARNIGAMIDRTHKEFSVEDIEHIGKTYQAWRGEAEADYCKSATLEDIKANDYVLTLGRYVDAALLKDDGIPFETKMTELNQTLYSQMENAQKLDDIIRKNLNTLGYGKKND